MTTLNELKKHLKKGSVYRRNELAEWSKSVDRHLDILLKEGVLEKLTKLRWICNPAALYTRA